MKTLLYITLFFASFTLKAQWKWLQGIPKGNNVYDIFFPVEDTGYVVGNFGTIMQTTDGGGSWKEMSSFKDEHYRAEFFVSSRTGWVVGLNGIILKTVDYGKNWQKLNLSTENHLRQVYFINKMEGWVSGDSMTIFKTTNGGDSWNLINSSFNRKDLSITDVQFVDKDTGYILCKKGYYTDYEDNWSIFYDSSYIYKTINAGLSWFNVLSSGGYDKIYSFSVLYPDTVFICSGTGGYLSSNGGLTWGLKESVSELTEVKIFKNLKKIGHLDKTWVLYNLSNSWFFKQLDVTVPFVTSMHFIDANTGYFLFQTGEISKIIDIHYNNWQNYYNNGANYSFLKFINNDTCLFGSMGVGYTTNHFNSIQSFCPSNYIYDIGNQNDFNFIASCEKGKLLKIKYNDTCININTNFSNKMSFKGISIPDSSLIFAVGDSGVVIRSTNNAISWETLNSGITSTLNTIKFINNDTGFFAGNQGVISMTINSGNSWLKTTIPVSSNLNKLFFYNKIGYCVGDNGVILKTNDVGNSWSQITSNTTQNLNDVFLYKDGYGIIVGENNIVLESTDSGNSWNMIPLYIEPRSLKCCSINDSGVFIGGTQGALLRYTPTWLITPTPKTPIPTEQPLKIYPNPTGNYIEIALPNVQGRLICTLSTIDGREVSRQGLSEGNRRVSTEGLAPGIYLVRVCNGERCWSSRLVRR